MTEGGGEAVIDPVSSSTAVATVSGGTITQDAVVDDSDTANDVLSRGLNRRIGFGRFDGRPARPLLNLADSKQPDPRKAKIGLLGERSLNRFWISRART